MTAHLGHVDADEETAWMARVARGDRAALALLYDRFAPRLLSLGLWMLGDRAEAEDVMHDVFLEAWRCAADFDPARGSVRAWLAVRMRSRVLDRARSPQRARTITLDALSTDRAADASAADEGLERAVVRAAVGALCAEHREVITLSYLAGLSTEEIGARLAVPAGTVKSRLHAARARLRTALTERGIDAQRERDGGGTV